MRPRSLSCLYAVVACTLPAPALACGFGEKVDPTELNEAIWTAVAEVAYADRDDLLSVPGEITVSAIDLNGDDNPELCMALETTLTCSVGNAVCLHLILTYGTPPQIILEDTSHGMDLGEGTHNGWRDLISRTQTVDGEVVSPVIYNGEFYDFVD